MSQGPMSGQTKPNSVLELFQPVVAEWFRRHLGEPSPIQQLGWPVIAAGQHALLIAPTGSGKTMAAFLLALDRLWRTVTDADSVRVLYVSPLRALNYDLSRNLEVPLQGVQQLASEWGLALPKLRLAVRTGDTPNRERARLLRKPPHILITTPESLHLLLTSRGREILRQVEVCIVDEWHALFPNKRGVFTCLLLERLACLSCREFQRIGLSATLRPADDAARMLGGVGREVVIVDLGQTRPLDVQVLAPKIDSEFESEPSVWSALESATLRLVAEHTSTLVFTNNRRAAERLSARLNDSWWSCEADDQEGASPPIRTHHGSLSLKVRRETEQGLKAGKLRAVVATASLELGLDIGSVDLVCQIESPGSVYRAWQRLGRSGHRVGAVCKGRFLAKTTSDLAELAALVRAMRRGVLETFTAPENCLDVLAQQIVAMVAMDVWKVEELFQVICRAWPYRQLPESAWENLLTMLSGRWTRGEAVFIRPRISWDKPNQRLYPMPGSQHLAIVNGGTIPDAGQYKVVLGENGTLLGTLDEEFVYERRLGDTFVLGTGIWRIEGIGADTVMVSRAVPGEPVIMPFWRGERLGRSWELGLAVGELLREITERLDNPDCLDWLSRECLLEKRAAQRLLDYVQRQQEQAGAVPCDRLILVEAFPDEMGDWYLAILTPFGQRWHFTLRLALEAWWKERYGWIPPAVHHDDGVLIRLLDTGSPPLDVLTRLEPERLETDILSALGECAFFAIRFRHNAMRALLLPRQHPHRRTPLWLQRLKARNWLQLVRDHPDFPIVVETYRECLREHLDLRRVREILQAVRRGEIAIHCVVRESPSPFAAQLRFQFTGAFMYDYDRVEMPQRAATVSQERLQELLGAPDLSEITDAALRQAEQDQPIVIRSEHELVEWLRQRGDVLPEELPPGQEERLRRLVEQSRVVWWLVPGARLYSGRWIAAEDQDLFHRAFGGLQGNVERTSGLRSTGCTNLPEEREAAWREILRRYLYHHASVSLEDILERYPLPSEWLQCTLQSWVEQGWLCAVQSETGQIRYARRQLAETVLRQLRRQQRSAVREIPLRQYAWFLLHWHGLMGSDRRSGLEGLRQALRRLQACWLPADCWESLLIRSRLRDYQPSWLDSLTQAGEWLWLLRWSRNQIEAKPVSLPTLADCDLAFLPRGDADFATIWRNSSPYPLSDAAEQLRQTLVQRGASFVVDLARWTGWSPSRVRQALRELVACGLVSNDSFDAVRLWDAESAAWERASRGSYRRRAAWWRGGEGRWFVLPDASPSAESTVLWCIHALLERYGVICRELAEYDGCPLPWSVLRLALEQLEWRGEVRRGYFVEGWSGEQYALPEVVPALYGATTNHTMPVGVTGVDPAALMGVDVDTDGRIFGADVRTSRRLNQAVVWLAGKPIIHVESFGERMRTLPDARVSECQRAVSALKDLAWLWRPWLRGQLRVLSWDGQPLSRTPAAAWLAELGFVRDYQGMTLYLNSE